MAERLFLFVQLEFPWQLGPSDGRYVLRGAAHGVAGGEPEHVVVLDTVGAARRRGLGSRLRKSEADPEAALVPTSRATVIDPVSLSAEAQARKWLDAVEVEREVQASLGVLNRMLFAHRIAGADAYLRELSLPQALTIRAGWGIGEQVAGGRWAHARELIFSEPRTRRRSAALRPQERLAMLLGGRESALLCEEHTLRARLDLDQGRIAHAAIELDSAYAAALVELQAEDRSDLAVRIDELRELRESVALAAQTALKATVRPDAVAALNEDGLRHALGRLEAALRARTAVGWQH
jgi:hypothetical protein